MAGITEIVDTLKDWEWCYGKTPKFTISRTYSVPPQLVTTPININEYVTVTITVEKGRISDVSLYLPPGLSSTGFSGDANVITNLKGKKFTEDIFLGLESSLGGSDNSDKFATEGEQQVMTSL